MSLLESPSFKTTNTIIKSHTLPNQSYILSLASLDNFYAASASAPSNAIFLFDKPSLQCVQTLQGHETANTSLRTITNLAGSNRQMLLSSGKDGCVKAWDERSGAVSVKMTSSGRSQALLSCDASNDGLTIAAGTDLQKEDAFVLYWDPRNPVAPLRTHGSTHSDDITAVHFCKRASSSAPSDVLLSVSSDGLVSISDAHEPDEDEAVLHVGNWGCSVSQAGWVHTQSGTRVWAASDMETFSCWSNELDPLSDLDIRSPSVHNQQRTWVTDYLIGCHNDGRLDSGLGVFVGSNEGDVALISSSNLSNSAASWSLHSTWTSGHAGVVRSLHWDQDNEILVTGGEDSKINLWRCPSLDSTSLSDERNLDDDDMDTDSRGNQSLKRDWDDGMDIEEAGGKRAKR
ncbi:WD40 repeat-like protein [Leucogyrophana mollusca]|uniref:WD40 repeat-like protein n=1 Tax=Leucogyrophana mollusca TaxID=85980 RepID=A0ACB8C1Z1_9AGAM|nr:WD40 repeat-like protein [Leucogyrophana mollusca]